MNSPDRDPVPLSDEIARLRVELDQSRQDKRNEAQVRQNVESLLGLQAVTLESREMRPTDADLANDVNHALAEESAKLASINRLANPDE